MTREDFLSSTWNRYPALPPGSRAWGRILSLEGSRVCLERGGEHEIVSLTEFLRVGDWIAISPRGEATLLAPALARRRSFVEREPVLAAWSRFLARTRAFFQERGFLETPTPGLVTCPGTEPTLDVFSTEFVHGSRRKNVYLPTSPELHLKKALAGGLPKIFEIKTCYRNGEITSHHQPEFNMLEWYRAFEGPDAIAQDILDLIEDLAVFLGVAGPRKIELAGMAQLFEKYLGVKLSPDADFAAYVKIAEEAGLSVRPGSTIDDVFFLIFIERIEPRFEPETLMIVDRWPPFQAALARLTTEGWGDRFEAYWRGLELANAFHELNDPEIQRRRFAEDLQKKVRMGRAPIPLDEDFLTALESGMPPSSGVALGLERLFMALTNTSEISTLKLFPFSDERP